MSIDEVLEELRIPFIRDGHHHCRPGWIQTDCPFCGRGSGKFHMGWNVQLGYPNCWKCGGHSPYHTFVELGVAKPRAVDLANAITKGAPVDRETARVSYKIPDGIGALLPAHRSYLRERGLDPDTIAQHWHVKGIGVAASLSWRLFIPIIHQGREVSWTTRSISAKVRQRYISASAEEELENHKHLVYGADFCSHSVVVVEGPVDAWKIGPGAGALFGTGWTVAQLNRLAQHPCRYICFDSSPVAQKRARQLADELSAFEGVTEVITLDAEDPGSASPKELRLLRRHARL